MAVNLVIVFFLFVAIGVIFSLLYLEVKKLKARKNPTISIDGKTRKGMSYLAHKINIFKRKGGEDMAKKKAEELAAAKLRAEKEEIERKLKDIEKKEPEPEPEPEPEEQPKTEVTEEELKARDLVLHEGFYRYNTIALLTEIKDTLKALLEKK